MSPVIMTVDDCAMVRRAVGSILQRAGYTVVEACDGQEALDTVSLSSVDAVITDLDMPRLDGIGLIRALREKPSCKYLPIAMLTSETQGERLAEGQAAGASRWMVKPFHSQHLLTVVKDLLG